MSLYEILPKEPKIYFENLEGEEWRDVKDFPGYKVSNYGRIQSKFGQLMNEEQIVTYSGAVQVRVCLCKDTQIKHTYISNIVAEAFVDNPEGYKYVRHKDGNPSNNRADNLVWGPLIGYMTDDGRIIGGKGVKCVETGKVWPTMRDCAEELGVTISLVSRYKNRKSYKGMTLVDL